MIFFELFHFDVRMKSFAFEEELAWTRVYDKEQS